VSVSERRRGHHHHAPSGPGVVLDIGGDVGAVVVYLGAQATGEELDIQPVGDPAGRFHTGIHPRPLGDDVVRVAVFPEVRAGAYELLDEHGAPFAVLAAAGGEVRTVDLRAC
jgi:hypothetical protein